MKRSLIALLLAAAVLGGPMMRAALADPVPDPDLVARAKAEGTVVVYVAMSAEDVEKLTTKFQSVYGIPVRALRLVSNQIPAKLQIAQKANLYEADVQISPGYETDQMKRAGLLEPFRTPESKAYPAAYTDPDGYWTSCFLLTDVFIYNTAKLKAAGIAPPRAWSDFAKPEWKGKFAIFSASYPWYAALKRGLGEAQADALLRSIAANAPAMIATHQLAATMTSAGEYLAALNVFAYDADRMKKSGEPVDFVNPNPTVAELTGVSVVKNAPHPNAARLFVRWFLSKEGQEWMVASIGRISSRTDVANNPDIWNPRIPIVISNPSDSLTAADNVKSFNAIFGTGP